MGPPKTLQPYVRDFCASISPAEPSYLRPSVPRGSAALDCFENVRRHIEENGGERVLGWRIWEWAGLMIEAELHSVWRSPDGSFHDVTPSPTETVLFLPDAGVQYDGRQIDNIRKPLTDLQQVKHFIDVSHKLYEIMNRGERSRQHGAIHLEGAEAIEYRSLMRRKLELQLSLEAIRPGRNEPCRCGSGKKAKRCCFG